VGNIVPVGALRKPIKGSVGHESFDNFRVSGGAKAVGSLVTLGYTCAAKMSAADSPAPSTVHVSRVHLVVRVESEVLNTPRRFRMAIQAHLVELERKHKNLENELHDALLHLSTDDLQIAELKRRKLMVKDQIERLKHTAEETLH
jgi:hypothetical protein